jgi:phosphohistidine phosphatase
MRLYLMQHGESRSGDKDEDRTLTEQGRAEVRRVAELLARSAPDKHGRVHHSGKTRARETAEILTSTFDHLEAEESDGLAPMDDPVIWAQRASRLHEAVALVGHLPHLAKLTSLLLVGDSEIPVVTFTNGGMVCLERSPEGVWSLRWSVVPWLLV